MAGAAPIVKALATPITAPYSMAANLVKGDSAGTAFGKAVVKPIVQGGSTALGQVMEGVSGKQDPGAAPTPPKELTAAEKAAQQEDARRKAKSELSVNRPGRSATALMDESAFPYRLV